MELSNYMLRKKKKEVRQACLKLKEHFVGIDYIIDELEENLLPWWTFPKNEHDSPLILNLWGMTGTGKTDLVRKLCQYLDISLVEIDMGEFGEGSYGFGWRFYDKYSKLTNSKCIILLDEFQKCKSKDEKGMDCEKPQLRQLWALLSDGIINVDSFYSYMTKDELIEVLDESIEMDQYQKENPDEDFEAGDGYLRKQKKDKEKTGSRRRRGSATHQALFKAGKLFISPQFVSILKFFVEETESEIFKRFRKNVTTAAEHYIKLLIEKENFDNNYLNFKHSCIMVAGNIDEVYTQSSSVDPDVNIEELYKRSLEITVPKVKQALGYRFRPEQIARLGNNHIIYRTLRAKDFEKAIYKYLDKYVSVAREQYDLDVTYDETVVRIIYREGVYPTQGIRPLFSTIQSLMKTNISKAIFYFAQKTKLKDKTITSSYDPATRQMTFTNSGQTFKANPILRLEELRTVRVDDHHTVIAVHEAGHALLHVLLFHYAPEKASAYKANGGGSVHNGINDFKNISKMNAISYITACYGGRAAEALVFGADQITTGTSSDLAMISQSLTQYIASDCFGEDIVYACRPESGKYPELSLEQKKTYRTLANQCYDTAFKLLKENWDNLLRISQEFLTKESFDKQELEELFLRYGYDVKTGPVFPYLNTFKRHLSDIEPDAEVVDEIVILPDEEGEVQPIGELVPSAEGES